MTDELKVVGKNLPRKDALKKATGAAQYSIDIKLPDMLFGECALSTAAPAIANAIYNPIGIRVSLPTMLDKGLKALNQN